MLTVFDGNETGGSMSRRRLLEIGGLGLGGLSLSQPVSYTHLTLPTKA